MSAVVTESVMKKEECVSPSEIAIRVVTDYQEFIDLKPVWDRVARLADPNHPFLEYDWIRSWFDSCGKGTSLKVLVLSADGEEIAIAPLVTSSIRMFGMPVRKLGFFYNDHVPRADFLVSRRNSEVLQAIWKHLRSDRSWDMLQLCQLTGDSETLHSLPALAAADGCPGGQWASGASPFIDLSRTSWQDYFASLPAKHRSNLRNRTKRLNQLGAVELEVVTDEQSIDEAMAAGLELEAAAWKGDSGTAISCDPELKEFYTTLAHRTAANGSLRLHFLKSGEKRVAFDYSLEHKGRMFLLKLGYGPEFAAYSPSNLLLSAAIERSFQQGLARYDFLGQFAEWKRNWAQDSLEHYWLYIFRGSKGRLLHFLKFDLIPFVKKHTAKGQR
jgi:CelD/BcsL family acetyltransferase involved in cellulose biosynthesis